MPKIVEKTSAKKHILIIEDEKPLAHALELKLTHEGYETTVSLGGREGLQKALEHSYDLILLDLIMPEMDGFAVLQELQAHKVKTPAMVLSNLGQQEDRDRVKALGAVDYFVKASTPIADIVKRARSITG